MRMLRDFIRPSMVVVLIGWANHAPAWAQTPPVRGESTEQSGSETAARVDSTRQWAAWRGPLATGAAIEAEPPTHWSESRNVVWKTRIPGKGHSTPIVWDQTVFLVSAIAVGERLEPRYSGAPGAHDNLPITHQHRFVALAVDRGTGKIRWSRTLTEAIPHEGGHYTGSLASASPVTDGDDLYVCLGSRGLYCLDFQGELRWKVDLGRMQTKHGHGEGSSPVLHGNTLVVNWDHEGESFVAAFDKQTGEQLWQTARDEVTSWATPIVVEVDERPQVVVSGTERIRGYDLQTGDVIWECGGLSANVVASPVYADGILYAASSYDTRALLAIRIEGARGDLTGSERVIWSRQRGTPYVPSPLLYDGSLYFLRHYQGILTRLTAQSGQESSGPFRLSGIRDVYASPVAAAGRVYVTSLDGVTLVISSDEQPRFIARNVLDDQFSASAAIAGRQLFLRGHRYLYCLAGTE